MDGTFLFPDELDRLAEAERAEAFDRPPLG